MASRKFKYVNHTADVEFVAMGKNLEECFANAFLALFDTICYTKKVAASKQKEVKIIIKDRAKTIEDLLWYALQDALSIADSKSIFPYRVSKVKIRKLKNTYEISTSVYGKKAEQKDSKLDAKAITRYNLKIEIKNKEVLATVVIDV